MKVIEPPVNTGIYEHKSGMGIVKNELAGLPARLRIYNKDNSEYGIEELIYDNPYYGKGAVNEDQTNH